VQLFEIHPRVPPRPYFQYGLLRILREHSSTLTGIIGQVETAGPLLHGGTVERIHPLRVTGNYFAELAIPPALGRVLNDHDEQAAVLCHEYWERSFGRNPRVLGQTVRHYNRAFTIVGVAPPWFTGTSIDSSADLWIPMRGSYNLLDLPEIHVNNAFIDESFTEIVARLRPGVTLAKAQAETAVLWNRYNQEANRRDPANRAFRDEARLELRSIARGTSPFREQSSTALWLLWSGTGLLLLIGAANAGGLLLARAGSRDKETAVLLAIGAGRARIASLWVTEGLTLALAGSILGTLAAYQAFPLLVRLLPPARGVGVNSLELRIRSLPFRADWRMGALAVAACDLITLVAGIAPVLRSSRLDLWSALKTSIGDRRHRRFQSALCALQVALSTVLLVSAGLAVRSLATLRAVPTGFDADHIATFAVDPTVARYTKEQTESLQRRLIDGALALPGVSGAAIAFAPLMRGLGMGNLAIFPDRPPEGRLNISYNVVSPEYFETMGMRIVAGHGFDRNSAGAKPLPAVVNQTFAAHFFPGQNPLGKLFATGRKWTEPQFQIVGVVNDTKYRSLREVPPPIYYITDFGPMPQYSTFILHVRSSGDPESLIPAVTRLLHSIDPRLPFYEVTTLKADIARSLWQDRMLAALATAFSLFSAVLATAGLYGLLAFFVAARRREIGLRMALGAMPAHLGRLLCRQLIPAITLGLAAGAALSFPAAAWLRSLLYQVSPTDPRTIAFTLLVMLFAIALAASIPTWRALRTDPASSLREE